MKLSREQVRHIALLARLGSNESELERFCSQLSDILDNFEILKQVETTHIPPTTQTVDLANIMREDAVESSYPATQIMANAPSQEDNCFKVRAVLDES
jgi:aspartyl-tRNA(Asn)/glutamyl-tRNA(Gln) amidotransferase subunit C